MTYPITIKMNLVEGVCPYTPPRVLNKKKLPKNAEIPYQPQDSKIKPSSTK
jgi:hypothetical protein